MEEGLIQPILKTLLPDGEGSAGAVRDIRAYSPLTLAYIGDGVYELMIRTMIVASGSKPVHKLHKSAVRYVSAPAQAGILKVLMEELTEEEAEVCRRGRNAKPHSVAKNASLSQYHMATGFEALLGYLYLKGENDRLLELVKRAVDIVDENCAGSIG